MRDYTSAIRSDVVLFEGGMGATLEQLDLSLEKDYKLPGRAHEVLILNRPDVIELVHESLHRGRRRRAADRARSRPAG